MQRNWACRANSLWSEHLFWRRTRLSGKTASRFVCVCVCVCVCGCQSDRPTDRTTGTYVSPPHVQTDRGRSACVCVCPCVRSDRCNKELDDKYDYTCSRSLRGHTGQKMAAVSCNVNFPAHDSSKVVFRLTHLQREKTWTRSHSAYVKYVTCTVSPSMVLHLSRPVVAKTKHELYGQTISKCPVRVLTEL